MTYFYEKQYTAKIPYTPKRVYRAECVSVKQSNLPQQPAKGCIITPEQNLKNRLQFIMNPPSPKKYRPQKRNFPKNCIVKFELDKNNKLRPIIISPPQKDYRQENRGILYKGKLVSPTNNPLYEKAGMKYRASVSGETEYFVRFPTYSAKTGYNKNHQLLVPKQEANAKPYIDYRDFMKRASHQEKLDLDYAIKKYSHKNSKIRINVGTAREIPYFHVHIIRPQDSNDNKQ